jgi:hypothetical protein
MSKKWMFSFVLVCVMFSANAQFRKIPAEVTDSFKVKYKNASGVSWKDKLTSFQAEFKDADKRMKATFSSGGGWLKTETKHSYKSLPSEVKDGFKKSKFANLNILELLQVEVKDRETQYHIAVKKNNITKRSLIFSKSGQLISDNASF